MFDDSGDDIVLSRQERADEGATKKLPPGERAILRWDDGRGGSVTIDKANGKSLKSALSRFQSAIESENRHRFFRRNLGWFVLGLVITAAALILVLIFGDLSEGEIGLLFATGMVSIFVGVFIVPFIRLFSASRKNVRSVIAFAMSIIVFVVFLGVFGPLVTAAYRSLPDDFGRALISVFSRTVFHSRWSAPSRR